MKRLRLKRIILFILILIFITTFLINIISENYIIKNEKITIEDIIFDNINEKLRSIYYNKYADQIIFNQNYILLLVNKNLEIKNKDLVEENINSYMLQNLKENDLDLSTKIENKFLITLFLNKNKLQMNNILSDYLLTQRNTKQFYLSTEFYLRSNNTNLIKTNLEYINIIIELSLLYKIKNINELTQVYDINYNEYCYIIPKEINFSNSYIDYLNIRAHNYCNRDLNENYLNQIKIYKKEKDLKEEIRILLE